MIDEKKFRDAWSQLASRFGRENDPRQAAEYYRYLCEEGLSTEQFLEAARSLWATARFFPRPADFLATSAVRDLPLLYAAAERFCPPKWDWHEWHERMSTRGKLAVKLMGGMDSVRQLYERSIYQIKGAFETAFEQVTAEESKTRPEQIARAPRRNSELQRINASSLLGKGADR